MTNDTVYQISALYNDRTRVKYEMTDFDARRRLGIAESRLGNTVDSVNGQSGAVSLTAADVGALPSNTTYVSSVNGSSGAVTVSIPDKLSDLTNDAGFVTSAVTSFNGDSGDVTYAAPVSSVNGETGAVVLDASDVGALPSNTTYVSSVNGSSGAVTVAVPSKLSDLTNDSGFITSGGLATVATTGSYDDLEDKPTASSLGAYVLPSGGIPSSDLSSAVQTSLGKADTALQSAPVTSVNGQTGAVTVSVPSALSDLTNDIGAYTMPSGGIPLSDLASAVRTSLGKADTALQSAPVTSVNGATGAVTGLQTTSNLVTSVSSSSTNAQYPSAKLFYDTVGNIETLLAGI